MNNIPLRYSISSWRQLPQCLSNTSRNLRIHIADFIENPLLRGFRITVDHAVYGTVFACILNARGDCVLPPGAGVLNLDKVSYDIPKEVILKELEKYGFFITYDPRPHLSGDQIEYLLTLKNLKFDKIRRLVCKAVANYDLASGNVVDHKTYLVAFKAGEHVKWLDDKYVASEKELSKALLAGTATNLTEVCQTRKFNWEWLDYVASIDDIISDNSIDNIWELAWNKTE